jgi:hypothetical protein
MALHKSFIKYCAVLLKQSSQHRPGVRMFSSPPVNDEFNFQGQMSEANREMASLFGPLGDPDYDCDSEPSAQTNMKNIEEPLRLFTQQMKAANMKGVGPEPNTLLSIHSQSHDRQPTVNSSDDPVQRIVTEHHNRLVQNVQELLDDHYVGLCAALRTELRKQKLKNKPPLD